MQRYRITLTVDVPDGTLDEVVENDLRDFVEGAIEEIPYDFVLVGDPVAEAVR